MEKYVRVFIYALIVAVIVSLADKKRYKNLQDNTMVDSGFISLLCKVSSLFFLIFPVLVEVVYILITDRYDNGGLLLFAEIFLIFPIFLFPYALYLDSIKIVFDDEKITENMWFGLKKVFYYKDISMCIEYSDKYDILDEITEIRTCYGFREKVIQESTKPHRQSRFKLAWLMHSGTLCSRMHSIYHSNGRKIKFTSGYINSERMLKKLRDKNISVDNIEKRGYYVKGHVWLIPIVVALVGATVWFDIWCIRNYRELLFFALICTGIAVLISFLCCRKKFFIDSRNITEIRLFGRKKTIEVSSVSYIFERYDLLQGRHLMIYVKGEEKPVFDMDASCLDTDIFENEMKKKKLMIDTRK